MQKKLTISIDALIYEALHDRIGRGHISEFIETLVRPHVVRSSLDNAYESMAHDLDREKSAKDWVDSLIEGESNEAW